MKFLPNVQNSPKWPKFSRVHLCVPRAQARLKARIVVFRQRWRASGTTMDRGLFLFLLSSVSSSFFPPHPRSTVSTVLLCNWCQTHCSGIDDHWSWVWGWGPQGCHRWRLHPHCVQVITESPHTNSCTMYRIVGTGPVIFLQHGMVGSSTAWYLLAKRTWYWRKVSQDAGRSSTRCSSLSPCRAGLWCLVGQLQREPWEQVPLNSRSDLGVSSLREHKTLDPDNDDEYWQFAQDEMSKYDLPSQLNYVLQITNKKKGVVWIFHKYIKSFPTDFLYGPFYGHNDVHGDELDGPHLGRQGRAGRLLGACGFCCTHEESCKGKRKHCHLKIWKFINTQASVNYAKDWLGQLLLILGLVSPGKVYHL